MRFIVGHLCRGGGGGGGGGGGDIWAGQVARARELLPIIPTSFSYQDVPIILAH